MKRTEAISVLREILESSHGLDGHYFELSPPIGSPQSGGYQIVIHATLDPQTVDAIKEVITKHGLTYQTGSLWKMRRSKNKTEPDTFIIYKPR